MYHLSYNKKILLIMLFVWMLNSFEALGNFFMYYTNITYPPYSHAPFILSNKSDTYPRCIYVPLSYQ
jgi:hypothetical protein